MQSGKCKKQCAWGQCACDCPQCQHGTAEHQGPSRESQTAWFKTNSSIIAPKRRKNSEILALTARTRGVAGAVNETHVCPHQTNLHGFALRTRDLRAMDADAKLVKKHFGTSGLSSSTLTMSIPTTCAFVRLPCICPRPTGL